MWRNRAHFARNREARCVDLCHQHLSLQPKNGDSTFKVIYIVGTGNKDKLINMELDMQKKPKHVRLELSVDIELSGNLLGCSLWPARTACWLRASFSGTAGSIGRIGNCASAIEKLRKGENLRLETTEGLERAV
jgi:hypothetical protein